MTTTTSEDEIVILNVNDHEGARYVVSVTLRRAGFQVIEASSGFEALEKIEQHQPMVVILDVNLPDIDGYEVCRRIRANPRVTQAKILHTSGTFVAVRNRVQSFEEGADGYLTQPFEPQELIAIVRSLVRLRRTEDSLRAHTERLQEADRRKDEFLAMLAHELRNPLAALTNSLPLVERRPALDDIERRGRDVIRRQTSHLSRLIDDLLDVARVTQGKIDLRQETFDLRELLGRVAAVTRTTRVDGRRQRLTLTLPPQPAMVRGDGTRIEQIFMNLLDNASKYTDPGGEIEVIVGVQYGEVKVSVRDNGIGIAPDVLPVVFGLFAQAGVSIARSRGGLGIGLTLVRTLVELHGGRVEAFSDGLGTGSDFTVTLPLAVAEIRPERAAAAAESTANGLRILIVEDNLDAQQTLADLCNLWGHQVQVASDGREGLRRALEETFDVALVDVGLPLMDGYQVARHVRRERPRGQLALVALTGYGAPEQRAEALSAGFDVHLVKPAEPESLRALLRTLGHAQTSAQAVQDAS